MPNIHDYGGNRTHRTPVHSDFTHSLRCDSCGTLRYVTARELRRAARPRCLKCGGLLIETKTEEKKHKAERQRILPDDVYRCANCGQALQFEARALAQHLLLKLDCFQYYRLNKPTTPAGALFGTLWIEKKTFPRNAWIVCGVLVTGKYEEIKSFDKQYLAQDFVHNENENRE